MERAHLEAMLAQGLSLAEIGRRVGRHEATVAYWLKKYGLRPTHPERHAPRGALERERLELLVRSGLSIAQIARETERSKGTVRHWLMRYGLKTRAAGGRHPRPELLLARASPLDWAVMTCAQHGRTEFARDRRGYFRCKRCRAASVSRRRRRVKRLLIAEAGGACRVCGYSRNPGALHFHHVDPSSKRMEINARGAGVAIERLREEAQKCVLLCANCHAEVEAGLVHLPAAARPTMPLAPPQG